VDRLFQPRTDHPGQWNGRHRLSLSVEHFPCMARTTKSRKRAPSIIESIEGRLPRPVRLFLSNALFLAGYRVALET